jgi:hypothetical protein
MKMTPRLRPKYASRLSGAKSFPVKVVEDYYDLDIGKVEWTAK